jgi:hypothetical protein
MDQLAVVDPGNARLSIYRLAADALSYETQVAGPWSSLGSGRNLCSIDGRWFIHNLRDGLLIHEVSDDGSVVRSFGAAVPTTRAEFGGFAEIAAPQRNAGSILCLPDRSLIVSLAAFDSHVRAYSPDGTLQWDAALPEVRPVRILAVDRALRSEYDAEQGSHIGRSVVRWSPESVLVQYSWSLRPGGPEDRDYHRLDSIELATTDGAIVGRTTALPLVVDTRGDIVYSFENLPFPRVRLLRRGG